jgi:hypothetical protein
MELVLVNLSTIHAPEAAALWLGSRESATARDDLERNRLLRLDSRGRLGEEWREAPLSARRTKAPEPSTADEVVGVETTGREGAAGGLGS